MALEVLGRLFTTAPKNYANSIREWEAKLEYEARVAAGNTRPRHYPNGVWISESIANYLMRLEDTGHRIVVFDVSGIINLESDLNIYIPYITIAGQTSTRWHSSNRQNNNN